ncbi:MAG: VCBS repeat-containing protein [Candidatus Thermoplasmatota archaeon]|nr:VCBS repeat-containing protein [Candidatus Thermoplasmatota archaeon]
MLLKSINKDGRARAISLVLIMLLSTTAANLVSASTSRTYTTDTDPVDVALGDFDCDGDLDIVTANDRSTKISVLWNENGHFQKRTDVWTSANPNQDADFEDHSNTQQVEVGEFTGDDAIDIVIYARNRPLRQDATGAIVVDKPGNVTVIENDGCNVDTFTIGEQYDVVWMWDLAVADLDQDGNDDIVTLELLADLKQQRVVTYRGPITSSTQAQITSLGDSTQNSYRELELGDWGEPSQTGLSGSCDDIDLWLVRSEGVDYITGAATNPGKSDNVTVLEFDCQTNSFPATFTWSTAGGQVGTGSSLHVHALGPEFGGFDIGDLDEDGIIDVVAINDANTENVTYATITQSTHTYSQSKTVYFGPYIAWEVTVGELNGDGEPDFVHAAKFKQSNATSSTGDTTSSYYLNLPTSVQVTLSNGNGGHMNPLEYFGAMRPTTVAIGQVIGGPNSAPDLIVGHGAYDQFTYDDNFGWDGSYDRIVVIEMDNKDLAVSSIDITPTDVYVGALGEGTREVEVSVTNTGMDILNGQATLDVEIKEVDEAASTNVTVYAMDWDNPEDKTGCNGGCGWTTEAYYGVSHWHEEVAANSTEGHTSGNNAAAQSANANNPTDFMWSGVMKTNSSGDKWSGYEPNWDEGLVLNDVDLTGADRAWMSIEIFRHLGLSDLYTQDTNGYVLAEVWDDAAMIEVFSEDVGWVTVACPTTAFFSAQCASGTSYWGGYDNGRQESEANTGLDAAIYRYGGAIPGTQYGWGNFTEEDLGAFDLSRFAGDTIDIRFRFKSGWEGSLGSNETLWSGRDGFAIDNVTIWKQNTAFTSNVQNQQSTINMNNLAPNEDYSTSIQADFVNGTTYRISAVLNYADDEQPANDEIVGYVTAFNIYDPAVIGVESFKPGSLYAEGNFPVEVKVEHLGNTNVTFDLEATVFSALPTDVYCGSPLVVCEEGFEGGSAGFRYTDDSNANGGIIDDSSCTEKIFGSHAYWFGHPCDTPNSFGDVWENETLTIPGIDLTNMSGDYVALNFEYFAETWFEIQQSGATTSVNDYAAITADWTMNGNDYEGLIYGQWIDYNEDGFCIVDEDGNGFIDPVNETTLDNTEIEYIGDPVNVNGGSGNYNVFFNTDGLVQSRSIDLTHLYVVNTTSPDSNLWTDECLSLAGSVVDINFEFLSNDDGHNGQNDGVRGVAFDNISLQEFTFSQDAVYTTSVIDLDAEENRTIAISNHDFVSGVYMIEVESQFDNTTAGTPWFGYEEISVANNVARVIFSVESVDITLGKPDQISCLDDVILDCVLPIDSAKMHDWSLAATNGVLQGDYTFHMTVVDEADGSQVHTTTAGPSVTLGAHERTTVSFTPWNGWMDGHSYNISYHATLPDGSTSGNVRYFHATFADHVDIAILSGDSTRVSAIKEDMVILGMSYTQYDINDWDDYLDLGWMTHYDKVIMPWQEVNTAKPSDEGGKGYYERIGGSSNQNVLKSFMSAGGTVQVHLSGATDYYEYSSSTGESLLPFDMDIQPRNTPETRVTYSNMEVADPYHPILEDVDLAAFQGFDQFGTVTEAIINTKSASATAIPRACNGYSEEGGSFQRLLQSEADVQDTVLGVCSYVDGGLIVTTVDVSSVSERADSSTFPLLGNMLSYQVSPYPAGFGTLGSGLDLTINGEVPLFDPSTGGYQFRYMKSNSELTFSYITTTSETLSTDWVISGPTDWEGASMASGTDHTDVAMPTVNFCKTDLSSATGCLQGATWEVTLYLHDEAGHSRTISVTVMTDDTRADEFRPISDAQIDMRDEYEDNIEDRGVKSVSGIDWPLNRIHLDESGSLTVHFDAGNSSDADALSGNGIETYEWTVLFDKPYNEDNYKLEGHTFIRPSSSDGEWAYTFNNVTVDPSGQTESLIRIELVVFDQAGKSSDKYKMYFSVVPEGFGDAEPTVQINLQLNGSRVDTDTITLTGNVVDGAEQGDVYVEAALLDTTFDETAVAKYTLSLEGKWAKSEPLGDGDGFELTLNIEDLFDNETKTKRVFMKVYEGDDKRWPIIYWIEITLPSCKGLTVPVEVLDAEPDAYFIWNEDTKSCEWSGEYTDSDGDGVPDKAPVKEEAASDSDNTIMFVAGGIGLLVIVLVSLFFVLSGGKDKEYDDVSADFGATAAGYGGVAQMDPMEQYVQQLIAQGYPEETARAYAAQYAGHFQQQQ